MAASVARVDLSVKELWITQPVRSNGCTGEIAGSVMRRNLSALDEPVQREVAVKGFGLGEKVVFEGVDGCLGPIAKSQFAEDIGNVVLHCSFADDQLLRDLGVRGTR